MPYVRLPLYLQCSGQDYGYCLGISVTATVSNSIMIAVNGKQINVLTIRAMLDPRHIFVILSDFQSTVQNVNISTITSVTSWMNATPASITCVNH